MFVIGQFQKRIKPLAPVIRKLQPFATSNSAQRVSWPNLKYPRDSYAPPNACLRVKSMLNDPVTLQPLLFVWDLRFRGPHHFKTISRNEKLLC